MVKYGKVTRSQIRQAKKNKFFAEKDMLDYINYFKLLFEIN